MNTVQTPYGEIDVSKLRVGDVANLALQRTDTLFDTGIPKIRSPSYLFWARFKIALPLKVEASLRWRGIVSERSRSPMVHRSPRKSERPAGANRTSSS